MQCSLGRRLRMWTQVVEGGRSCPSRDTALLVDSNLNPDMDIAALAAASPVFQLEPKHGLANDVCHVPGPIEVARAPPAVPCDQATNNTCQTLHVRYSPQATSRNVRVSDSRPSANL